MASNLCSSYCVECGRKATLADLRGKPVEFRRTGAYVPHMGVRWDCPDCGTAYFAMYVENARFWSSSENAFEDYLLGDERFPNTEKGRFVRKTPDGRIDQTGCYSIDLAFYETGRDEPMSDGPEKDAIRRGEEKPRKLYEGEAEECEWTWGDYRRKGE